MKKIVNGALNIGLALIIALAVVYVALRDVDSDDNTELLGLYQ